MNRSTCASRLGATIALLSLFSLTRSLEGTTTLIGCSPIGGTSDTIARAFYIPNFPGVSLRTLTLNVTSDTTGHYILTLVPHLDTFDGPVLGSATSTIDLTLGASTAPLTFVFGEYAALPVPAGHTIAFVLNRTATGTELVSFATGTTGACGAVETNDATAPLSVVKGSVPLTVTGDAAAPQLVTNGTFASNTAGLTTTTDSYPVTIAFDTADANGSASSGSARVTNVNPAASGLGFVLACIPNTGPGAYSYGAKIKVNAGQGSAGSVSVGLESFSSFDCSGSGLIWSNTNDQVANDGEWHAVSSRYTLPTDRSIRSIAVMLIAIKNPAGGTFAANFDDVFLRPAQVATLTIPGIASIHGQAGSFFHTDLWVLNRSYANAISVSAKLRCLAGLPCGISSNGFTLQPREQRLYSDVLHSLLSAAETAGVLELTWDASFGSISASARTYSPDKPAPTNGTGVPALSPASARARAIFTGLASNGGDLTAGFRSNVGAYNPSSVPTTVTYALFDATGLLLGSATHAFAANEAYQFNDIFAVVGSGSTVATGASLVLTSSVPVFSFVTVIDNQTNDSSYLLPTDDEIQP